MSEWDKSKEQKKGDRSSLAEKLGRRRLNSTGLISVSLKRKKEVEEERRRAEQEIVGKSFKS